MAIVRRLTDSGTRAFEEYLSGGAVGPPPIEALGQEPMSVAAHPVADVAARAFVNRLDLGRYLNAALGDLKAPNSAQDVGLWSWLALFYFDGICPVRPDGQRRVRQHYSYILSRDYRHYYRHLVAAPCVFAALHDEFARCLLHPPVDRHGDFVEQLASRQEIITNRELIQVVDRLYFDPARGKPKRGATDRNRAGNLRRLVALVQQLELTYDLHAMKAPQILGLLPAEFDEWKPPARGARSSA